MVICTVDEVDSGVYFIGAAHHTQILPHLHHRITHFLVPLPSVLIQFRQYILISSRLPLKPISILIQYHHRHILHLIFLPFHLFLHMLYNPYPTTLILSNFSFSSVNFLIVSFCKLSMSSNCSCSRLLAMAWSSGDTI